MVEMLEDSSDGLTDNTFINEEEPDEEINVPPEHMPEQPDGGDPYEPEWAGEYQQPDKIESSQYKPFPGVYMDIKVDGQALGRVVFNLFNDLPITAENFRSLCTGERTSEKTKKKLTFKGMVFHRIIPDFLIQGGDITSQNGQGGESIYGQYFSDENFWHKHDKRYLLAMANCGEKDTNCSQFYITLKPLQWLDGNNGVFGEVTQGKDVVDKLEKYGTMSGEMKHVIQVVDCGEGKDIKNTLWSLKV